MAKDDPEWMQAYNTVMEKFDEAIEPLSSAKTVKLLGELIEELISRRTDLNEEMEMEAEEAEEEEDEIDEEMHGG